MSAQQALALPSPAASNTVVINARCSLRIAAGRRVVVVAGLPVHHYRAEDAVAEAYAMVFLVELGFAQQTEVSRAFARSVRSVRRYQRRYAQGGMGALGRAEGWRRGRRRISRKRLRSIEMLKSQGMSNRAIAHRLGVSEKAIDPGQFVINIKAPTGSNIDVTETLIGRVEKIVREEVAPDELGLVVSNIGSTPDFSAMYTSNSAAHTAFVQTSLKEGHSVGSYEYMDRVRRRIRTSCRNSRPTSSRAAWSMQS